MVGSVDLMVHVYPMHVPEAFMNSKRKLLYCLTGTLVVGKQRKTLTIKQSIKSTTALHVVPVRELGTLMYRLHNTSVVNENTMSVLMSP